MKKVLFIDRDGCLIEEPQPDQQVDSLEKLAFMPGVITALSRIAAELDYVLVMVTNQDGLGTDSFPENTFWPAHQKMLHTFETEGVRFQAIHIDRSFAHTPSPGRKPGTAMLTEYMDSSYDLANSFVIGDRLTDMELAHRLGTKGILIRDGAASLAEGVAAVAAQDRFPPDTMALAVAHWADIYAFLQLPPRKATHRRSTKETDISIGLNLDGQGHSAIHTGLGFFDHMLDQLARHGGFDLELNAKGDLHIDEHHTIEDTALTLGETFAKALGDKRGIERYGFCLPMDDVLAQVALDFGGRPWLVWDAAFRREKIGDMPTEMFYHFFKSFSDAARCNLNIRVEGENEHHKIEAIFKAFAKALKMAVKRTPGNRELPTTKGVI